MQKYFLTKSVDLKKETYTIQPYCSPYVKPSDSASMKHDNVFCAVLYFHGELDLQDENEEILLYVEDHIQYEEAEQAVNFFNKRVKEFNIIVVKPYEF
jgi:hypothetical protein